MISLFCGLFSIVTNYLYTHVINPGFIDVIIQATSAKLEAKGASAAQIEQMEKGVRFMMNPIFSSIVVLLLVSVVGTVISLITSAFLRRPAVSDLATTSS